MALIECNGLNVSLAGRKVLEGLSIAIERGDRLGIIGESGAGKSVLAMSLIGLQPEAAEISGTISFDGAPLPKTERELARLRAKRIGVLPQNAGEALDPTTRIGAQLFEALSLAGKTDEPAKQTAALLADVALDPAVADRYAADLSNEDRQFAMLAMALAGAPELLIADEPGATLDLLGQRRMIDVIARLSAERNMALLLISADLKIVAALCNKVIVLKEGRAIESGATLSLFVTPRHEYTKLLLGAGRHRPKTLMHTPIGPPLLDVRGITRNARPRRNSALAQQAPGAEIENISFVLRTGESLALTGPSGSGKSTLARIVAGLDLASSGEMKFDTGTYHGSDLLPLFRRDISFVFSDPVRSFDPHRTVGDSVAEPLRLEPQRLPEEIAERILETVAAVGLAPDILGLLPHAVKRGDLQRLAIARALISKPRLIVLDEPAASLDVLARGEIITLLNRLRADYGMTFLIVSNDFEMIRQVSDRVMVMERGKIIETATPVMLLDSPEQPLTRRLVAARLAEIAYLPPN
ncbi:MAG: ATP-binding cassette domain-containing protein [Devosia sp.]